MKHLYIAFAFLFGTISCHENDGSDNILSEDDMVNILVDIHLTEGFVQSLSIPYDSTKILYPILERRIFEKHGIPDSVYIKSLEYYLRDATKMEYLYERAIDSLSVKEKEAQQNLQP
ncbi:DUF4296 domain-containing protein [Cyclobacterium amurskyense]|uniref:DUF4296 domain-containing protein n=1 Tax=Cyclobacterium amurskyense TaxID=320787 RepID=A0A0H4PAX5_9BACT|nr:DUF4296 domain-containing protein [Cyclobacterium amurskyense]AKP50290.1 hypothetical protein CA2015_0832 [Cyclobacterium amurskyense]